MTMVVAIDGRNEQLVTGDTVVGRDARSGIRLDDPFVSPCHAIFYQSSDGWCVEDLGSANGLVLNGRPVRQASSLAMGDKILVGRTVLTVVPI
jgi:pSer/pThr/pTyr-binding forkhead associated (FHA) protein